MCRALRLATRGHRRGPRGRFGLPDGKVRVSEAVSAVNGAERVRWDNNSEYRRVWQAVRESCTTCVQPPTRATAILRASSDAGGA